MTFRESGFRNYFSLMASPSSVNSYLSGLRAIDRSIGGLDEAIGERGSDGVWRWALETEAHPFGTRRSDAKSFLKKYLGFISEQDFELIELSESSALSLHESGIAFDLERSMQSAVRRSIASLEPGLTIIDQGVERIVSTGKIDILCRDGSEKLTVVELKAGRCPPGTIEQALGYADSLSVQDNEPVRAVVIASSFSDRQIAAARRIPELKLYTYDYLVSFAPVAS